MAINNQTINVLPKNVVSRPCNSGKKYKFCCMNKEIELDIEKGNTPIFFSLGVSCWGCCRASC
ncbi:SEC-C metal-binding domain-containing protein [Bacillus toyonensis]|uniref:SEC-C metal-binding domain-containing protein n=1 Tax=Bacillus toyonensis TaxID=155322 RepID=UPI00115C6158|nr:SEC-C metal-binding domain-containing protein [Bacillus toyonensis]